LQGYYVECADLANRIAVFEQRSIFSLLRLESLMLATGPTRMLTCKQTADFELKHARNVESFFMGPSNKLSMIYKVMRHGNLSHK
jgi:hypothetical protein